jgi:methylmalonyl-CoA/ethylmalonyl-CoA epimerase
VAQMGSRGETYVATDGGRKSIMDVRTQSRLHHVSILASDVLRSIGFYQERLGMQVIERDCDQRSSDCALLATPESPGDLNIELVAPAIDSRMARSFELLGPHIDHICFAVDDISHWEHRLARHGVHMRPAPHQAIDGRALILADPCGSHVELLERPKAAGESRRASVPDDRPFPCYQLHHASITCWDISNLEQFYCDVLGMKTVFEAREDGYIFLADASLLEAGDRAAPALEIMGPPGIEAREAAFLQRYGPGLDHICFVVDDVDQAFRDLSREGIAFDLEPMDYASSRISYFKDPNGVDIELMAPVDRGWRKAF